MQNYADSNHSKTVGRLVEIPAGAQIVWTDNDTNIDYLNFGVVAKACASLLKSAHGAPISIGVSGGWGAGKSSLVRMIADKLSEDDTPGSNTYVVITFNPWLYQDFEGARSALLQIVGDKILQSARDNESLARKAKTLLKRINLLRVAQLGGEAAATLITGLPVGAVGKAIRDAGDLLQPERDNAAEDTDSVVEGLKQAPRILKEAQPRSLPSEIQAFRDAVEELLEELKITLVVFVDDLDRCLPKTAIATLESIRLLLFLKRSAFVIAADNAFIRGAVRVHFEGTEITDEVATNYFDKLIQIPLHVPRLGVNEAKGYLALLLLERAVAEKTLTPDNLEAAKRMVMARLQSSWKGEAVSADFLKTLVAPLTSDIEKYMTLAEGLAPLLVSSSSVNANPRLMKRFLNIVFLRSSLAAPQGIELDIPALAKWHLLERCKESLANEIGSRVASVKDGRVEILRQAEEAVASVDGTAIPKPFDDDPFVREWLSLNPQLGESDLRPLLHLSRDSATRDFGTDDLDPAGRSLRDALLAAKASNEQLTKAIKRAGVAQAEKAMTRAWAIKSPKITWTKGDDLLCLIEPCRVFPELGKQVAAILDKAPPAMIGTGIVPALASQAWASSALDKWIADSAVSGTVKKAIEQSRKQGGR